MTYDGLCDMMALGNFCCLEAILERTFYSDKMSPEELEECHMAQWNYLQLCVWFAKNHIVKIESRLIRLMSIFHCSLVEFMAAMATEKKIMEKDLLYVPGCSSVELVEQLEEFLKAENDDLLIPFRTLVTKGHQNLDWSSAPFDIRHRNPDDILVELDNFSDFDLYPVAKLQPAVDAQVENDENDLMAGPTPGPSAAIKDASAPLSMVSH